MEPMRWALALAMGLIGGGCLRGVSLDDQVFPCRSAADCIDGYTCDAVRFVCVTRGTESRDAGPLVLLDAQPVLDATVLTDAGRGDAMLLVDAGPTDARGPAGIGDPCAGDGSQRCTEGTCVDGVCCKSACDGLCERCDRTPGECTAEVRGGDPADECPDLDCASLTWGLLTNTCYAYRAETRASTCDGAGQCTQPSCADADRGVVLAVCADAACVAPNACPRNRPVDDFDASDELCGGAEQRCSVDNAERGCCSPTGRCCAQDLCTDPPDPRCL